MAKTDIPPELTPTAPATPPPADPSSKKAPKEWAAQLGTDPHTLAAATAGKFWDRDPGLQLSKSDFEAAIKWVEGVSAS